MKNLYLISALALLMQGCLANAEHNPLGPSLAPVPGGGAGGTTLYVNDFNSAADLTGWQDNPGHQCCGNTVNPYLNSVGAYPYKTAPYSGYFPVYSTTVDRYYDMPMAGWSGDLDIEFYVLGAPRQAIIGYYMGGREASAVQFSWTGTNFNVQVVNGSTWTTVLTYNSGNINQWHQYRFRLHAGTNLTDYYIDGSQVASGVDSYTNGPNRYTSFTGFTIATKLGYDDVQIDDISITGF